MKLIEVEDANDGKSSPSPRRAWIEIKKYGIPQPRISSPSPRRAWIEMLMGLCLRFNRCVALPTEGVD